MVGQGHCNPRHFIASVAIIGLVFQALMAAVMLPMPLGMRSAQAAAAGPNLIVICTPYGMKQISFDAGGNPFEKQLPGNGCPVCDALAAVAFALPAADAAEPVAVAAADAGRPANEFLPASIACLAHNNRGPPFPA